SLQRELRCLHKTVIHADSADMNVQGCDPQLLYDFLLDRSPGLGAEPPDALLGIIATQGRKVHASDGAEHPGDLPVLYHGAARYQSSRAALDRAGIHANLLQPIQIQRSSAVRRKRASMQHGDCGRTSTLRRNDAIALLVRNFKPRPVFGVHTLSPEWEASLCSTEAEHITACCSIHPLEAACLRFTTHCSRIIPYGIFGAGRGPRQQL